jgi:FkbM family methyltransferase
LLNLNIGEQLNIDGRTCIFTKAGLSGHAVYGQYMYLEPSCYAVEFNLYLPGLKSNNNSTCASVDVVAEFGNVTFARYDVALSQFVSGTATIRLAFEVTDPNTFEFRVYTNGIVPLIIDDFCKLLKVSAGERDLAVAFGAKSFPDRATVTEAKFLFEHYVSLRQLYEKGAEITVFGPDVIVTISGVNIYARRIDDLRFIDEIYGQNTYNFITERDVCVIDVGMNIGLASLFFATKPYVKEVYSFELFKPTYERAIANLSINQEISGKITPHNFGLADTDTETVVLIDESDSGNLSMRGSGSGDPANIIVKNAAKILRPIIVDAKARGLNVIAKIDCEGAEFPIFEVLDKNRLFDEISVCMVEWHRGGNRTQKELIAPLLRSGFLVFDLTPKSGNGFFYAVKESPLAV